MKADPSLEYEIKSGFVNITDPCYTGASVRNHKLPAKNGVWETEITTSNEGEWGIRNSKLETWHESVTSSMFYTGKWESLPHSVGVDSGQAGVFDIDIYGLHRHDNDFDDKSSFYGAACAATLESPRYGTVFGRGIVSSSGFGDGGYRGECLKEDGKIIAVRILFIEDEYDDSESDDEDSDGDCGGDCGCETCNC